MASLNKKPKTVPIFTHEGGRAKTINYEQQLRRSVMACMLWENSFYEDGISIATRIKELVPKVKAEKVASMAIEAREKMKLRHVPLLLVREMARHTSHKQLVSNTLYNVIQRPDELSEFLNIYWSEGRCPIAAQVKKGLAKSFNKFNEYSLSKWNKNAEIKLKDVLFLTHAKPKDKEQEILWKKLVDDELKMPDSWEVALSESKGVNKKDVWERLLKENKIPAMALIKNLRNFNETGVDKQLIINSLEKMNVERVLPFRFITAARYAPHLEPYIETAMMKALNIDKKQEGKTILLIDVSGSMSERISSKSESTRLDAACGLAILAREMFEDIEIYTFAVNVKTVPLRRGFALRDAIGIAKGGTHLGEALKTINSKSNYDRIIVFTDEQSADTVPNPTGKGYVINIASSKNGVGYGKWTHLDGFSESVLDYIIESEID